LDPSSYSWVGVLAVLFALSALFSGSETAITALSKARLRKLKEDRVKGAETLERLLANTPRLLSTIILGNTLVNIIAASVATEVAIRVYGSYGVGIASGLTTLAILIFGEITPKTYAVRRPEKVALATFRLVAAFSYVLYPISKVLLVIANGILRLLGQEAIKQGPFMTADEIKTVVAIGEEEGVLEEEERKMIHSILEFGDTIVKEVMVPRTDMVAIEADRTVEEALGIARKHGYSRIPVYEGSLDNVIGILYVKDLLNFFDRGKLDVLVKDVAREPFFVPETKRVDELLREFQVNKTHMAIVVDEYGGTAGLVTLEDLLEEIVGEIFDEYDFEEEKRIEEVAPGEWLFDGRVDIDGVEELLGIGFEEEEAETIGGAITSLLGHVPMEGEEVEFGGYRFAVEKVAGRRVKLIRATKVPEPSRDESEEATTE
jgi:putative hemolysin